jgi:hypothetical protein
MYGSMSSYADAWYMIHLMHAASRSHGVLDQRYVVLQGQIHKQDHPPKPSSSLPPCFTPTLAGGLNCPNPLASYKRSVLMTNLPPSGPTALPSCSNEP